MRNKSKGFASQVQAAQRTARAAAKAQRSSLAELAALTEQERSIGYGPQSTVGPGRSQLSQSPSAPVQAWSNAQGLNMLDKTVEVNIPSSVNFLDDLAPVDVDVSSFDWLSEPEAKEVSVKHKAERQAKANRLTGQSKRNRDLLANRMPSQFDVSIAEGIRSGNVGVKSLQRSVTKGYLDMLAGITSTIGPAFGLQTNWDKYESYHNYLDGLVQADDENTTAAKIGDEIGGVLLAATDLGVFAGSSRSAGQKAYELHQQGKSTKSQMQTGMGSYFIGATTDRISKIASVATRGATVGLEKTRNLLEEGFTAFEKTANETLNYGLDWLAEKDEENPKVGKTD